MKSILPFIVIGVLITSGLGAVGFYSTESTTTIDTMRLTFSSAVSVEEGDEYVEISIEQDQLYLMRAGQPMVPKIVKTIELPFGVRNVQLEVTPQHTYETSVEKEIVPAPVPLPLTPQEGYDATYEKDEAAYSSSELFPNTWYSYTVGCGLNDDMKRVTIVALHVYPVRYIPAEGTLVVSDDLEVSLSYDLPVTTVTAVDAYDMVIIAPSSFTSALQPLIDHKNAMGVRTILKTTQEIYEEFDGVDKPEQIKYFIKDAIDQWDITYVLLIGGLKSLIYAKAMDTENYGESGWHVPVRWSNLDEGEPGPVTDLYYADVFKTGGEFDNWDSDNDGKIAEGGFTGDKLDLYPDVALGRLACRNTEEVQNVVNKIITYEQGPCDPSWFNKIIGITGDGFLDQEDLDFQWDTKSLPTGEYTIYAQSNNDEGEFGPIEEIHIQIDTSQETVLTFNHDDYLRMEDFPSYPAPPMAEIMTVSEGNILGNTDFEYSPGDSEAYLNRYFGYADVRYQNGVLHISGKTYDPKLYGNITDIHVWIENSNEDTVFDEWRYGSLMFAEGDWTVGDQILHGRGGAFTYMPEDFERVFLSSANGKLEGMPDVIEAFSEGAGFVFFSGHGSPNVWANHFPGVPGNRQNGDFDGLKVVNIHRIPPFLEMPVLPMNQFTNNNKLPVTIIGGCHNSMFTVSLIPATLDWYNKHNMHTYGQPVPETFSWYMIRLPEIGAIASIGNTGYGYGILGEWCTIGGLDNWITVEFFRQYGEMGETILGDTHLQTISSYISHFKSTEVPPDFRWDDAHLKTVEQWVLLGDPSLQLGGYE